MTRQFHTDCLLLGLALLAICFAGATVGCSSHAAPKDPPPGNRVFSPSWYEETQPEEDGRIYKTARANGASVTMSENKAINQAMSQMVLSIEARVDVMQRSFEEQVDLSGEDQLLERFQNVTTTVASRVLRGVNVVRKETYPRQEGDGYTTFVLVQIDGRAVDAEYLNRLRQFEELETRLRSSEAWSELERRAAELRQEESRGGLPPMTDKEIRGDG